MTHLLGLILSILNRTTRPEEASDTYIGWAVVVGFLIAILAALVAIQ